ncbi:uncharacterized protein [Chironomus tepperi]|uniref:uncharacterized protein n=1 Tax=Chironomus tepperi TaxID=113505 RepID=UPI00391F3F05
MERFTRPSDLPFPTIYHKFSAKDKDNDEIVEYRIQDLLEEDYSKGIDMMASEYCPEESFNKCRGVTDCPEAITEKLLFWRSIMNMKLSVGCYKGDELVGICLFNVHVKNEKEAKFEIKTEHNRDILSIVQYFKNLHDVYTKYNTDKYLTDFGMTTKKNYRHRGIAVEMLKARANILKAFKMNVTSTIFTVIGSQKAAVKANYEEILSVKWTDIAELFPNFDFSKADCEYCKIFDMKIENDS